MPPGVDDDDNGFIDDFRGWAGSTNTNRVFADDCNHGSLMAHYLGASCNDGGPACGMNWLTSIMPVALTSFGDVAQNFRALNYVAAQRRNYDLSNGARGAYVVAANFSYESFANVDDDGTAMWCGAVSRLHELGIITASSARNNGNFNHDADGRVLPIECPGELNIGATSMEPNESTLGIGVNSVDVATPFGPTSFAAGMVSGTVGLMHSVQCLPFAQIYKADPVSGARALVSALRQSVSPVASLQSKVAFGGMLNAGDAVGFVRDTLCAPDADADGIPDSVEATAGTNPDAVDSDGDGLCDGPFNKPSCVGGPDPQPLDSCAPSRLTAACEARDDDGDGLSNGAERTSSPPTNPNDPDSDDDTICDGPLAVGVVCRAGPDSVPLEACLPSPANAVCDARDDDGDGLTNGAERTAIPPTSPNDVDSDDDGICDGAVDRNGCRGGPDTAPVDACLPVRANVVCDARDDDGDGLNNGAERALASNPAVVDSDNDGICDGPIAFANCLAGPDSAPTDVCLPEANNLRCPTGDPDGDGVSNAREASLGTNPQNPDSDGDGLRDGDEAIFTTDPNDADTDDDGLNDGREVSLQTIPTVRDTDRDGLADGDEVLVWFTNPLVVDTDGDTLSDGEEVRIGTNPLLRDTNGNGATDAEDIANGVNPIIIDSDDDGVSDERELLFETDPDDADSDDDGIDDGVEFGDGLDDDDGEPRDSDDDGIIDMLDTDDDDDGISSLIETDADQDRDGLGNQIDLDSDGDGIPDALEGADDVDGDDIANFLDLDSDGDGLDDEDEGTGDEDGDGIADFLDPRGGGTITEDDRDGDGIANDVEVRFGMDPDDVDSDDDGVNDLEEFGRGRTEPRDTDGDGVIDPLDLDDDDDVFSTAEELAASRGAADPDGDGLPAWRDLDSDDDGVSDGPDDSLADSDGDGIADFLDSDSVTNSGGGGDDGGDGEDRADCAQAPAASWLVLGAALFAVRRRRRR